MEGLRWYERDFVAPVGTYYVDELYDAYGKRVNPYKQPEILDETSYYLRYGKEIIDDCSIWPWNNYNDFGRDGAPKDLKSMLPFQPDRYSLINGKAYLAQDLGNMVFGLYGKVTGYPEIITRLAGGYAQQRKDWAQRGKLGWIISRIFMFETFGDDPRGYYFVTVGREHYGEWSKNGTLPAAPKFKR